MSAVSDISRSQRLLLLAMLRNGALSPRAARSRGQLEVSANEDFELAILQALERLGLVDGARMGQGEDRARRYWLTDAGFVTAREFTTTRAAA